MLQWLKSLPGKVSDSWEKLMEARAKRAEKVALAKERWLYRQIDRVVNYKTVLGALLLGVLAHAALPVVLGAVFAAYVLKGIVTEALVRNQKGPAPGAGPAVGAEQPAPNLATQIANQITQALTPLVNQITQALAPLVPGLAQANALGVPAPQLVPQPVRVRPPLGAPKRMADVQRINVPQPQRQEAVTLNLTDAEAKLASKCQVLQRFAEQLQGKELTKKQATELAAHLRHLGKQLKADGVRAELILENFGPAIPTLTQLVKETLQRQPLRRTKSVADLTKNHERPPLRRTKSLSNIAKNAGYDRGLGA